jgi:hypothetical protein
MNLLGRMTLATIAVIILTVFCAAWATAGTYQFKVTLGYYDLMVDGWLNGHLYLALVPPPALLAREDPYVRSSAKPAVQTARCQFVRRPLLGSRAGAAAPCLAVANWSEPA